MEWCTWKETNLTQLMRDRFKDQDATSGDANIENDETLVSSEPSSHAVQAEAENIFTNDPIIEHIQTHLYNSHSKVSLKFGSSLSTLSLPIPKLSVVIMTVGTRGDIQPFCQLGVRLRSHGHRVRLATHECFREYVSSTGLEYYPLAGDPHRLSEFMVRTHGNIIPSMSDLIHEVPKNLAMVAEIINSCWNACVSTDPDSSTKPFIADAIISNPVTYGHIHCAEALGIPLHLMFPQVRLLPH